MTAFMLPVNIPDRELYDYTLVVGVCYYLHDRYCRFQQKGTVDKALAK